MKREQNDFLLGILENLPTILFVGLWKTGSGLEAAGWAGCLSAAVVLIAFPYLRRRFDTIVLGININFLLTTPVIVALAMAGQKDLARTAVHFAASNAVTTVFVVGGLLTLFSVRGFIGGDGISVPVQRRHSALLLATAAIAVVWSFAHAGEHWLSIVLPLIVLFATRRFLLARIADVDRSGAGPTPLAATALAGGEE